MSPDSVYGPGGASGWNQELRNNVYNGPLSGFAGFGGQGGMVDGIPVGIGSPASWGNMGARTHFLDEDDSAEHTHAPEAPQS